MSLFRKDGLILYNINTKNKERLKLIEQGINPDGQSISPDSKLIHEFYS